MDVDSITQQEISSRKPLSFASCIFADSWWNDSEQRNYILYECGNPENVGGKLNYSLNNSHGERTYSHWHKNEGMTYRCWSEPEKIAECPLALTKTEPEVDCRRFIKEEAHPSEALVTKKGLREKFYQPDALCLSCQNCIE